MTWLVRHGQSMSNAGLPTDGHAGIPLTALGRQQARELAAKVMCKPNLIVMSPFLRAQETAAPILARWPGAATETWEIGELTYLSPARCCGTTAQMRKPMVDNYWRACNPDFCDGPDAESFRTFMDRLRIFHQRLLCLEGAFAIMVGHGQFFSAYRLGLSMGLEASPEWMRHYREQETRSPLENCEIIALTRTAIERSPDQQPMQTNRSQ